MARRWSEHRSGPNTTLITHYAFLAVLPGLLAVSGLITVAARATGRNLENLQDGVFGRLPLIGEQIRSYASGRPAEEIGALLIGAAIALWAATRALSCVLTMNDDIWQTAESERLGFTRRRARSATALLRIGGSFLAASVLAGFIVSTLTTAAFIGGIVCSFAVNVNIVSGLLRLASTPRTRTDVRTGALLGAFAFTSLQLTGAAVIDALSGPERTLFGPTFALIAWIGFHAVALAISAEIAAHSSRDRHDGYVDGSSASR